MAKRSAYQQRVIKNYYENKDSIMLQRLGELVTDLYLAEGKGRERIWSRVESTLQNLGISKERRSPARRGQPVAGGQSPRRGA